MALTNDSVTSISDTNIPVGTSVVIITTEWNTDIVSRLQSSCADTLTHHNINHIIVQVPGAAEIPFAIKAFWERNKFKDSRPHAFIALGCVVKGETPHFDFICKLVTEGILQLNLTLCVPTIFGVLTVYTKEQAEERLGGIHGNKGEEFAITAIKMMALNSKH